MNKPKTFSVDPARLPIALAPLTKHKRWLVWRWEWKGAKWDKPPYQAGKPTEHAATNDPATWSSYAAAVKAVKTGKADGIGYVLTDSEVAAEDLDDCRDQDSGALTPWAKDMVDEARAVGAYVETTVSGTGLRIIGTAANGADYNTKLRLDGGGSIELYRRATRYITISGLEQGKCKELPNIDALLDGTFKRLNGVSKSSRAKIGSNYQPLDDWEVDAALAVTPADDYQIWFENGCVLGKKYGEAGRDRFHKWSATSEKYNKRQCDKKFDECLKVNGYNDGTIAYYANEHGPDWRDKGLVPKSTDPIKLQPHNFPDEKTIPRWDFLYGRHLLRRTVSGTAATGSTGKTSMSLVEALAMASGKPLLGEEVPRPLRVLLICLEDNRNAMDKRIAAAMKHHRLTPKDIGGRLFVKAKAEISFKIAKQKKGDTKVDSAFVEEMIKQLRANKIDVLSIDPFLKTHGVSENDNTAIGAVVDAYDEIAERADGGISLWHHTRKGNALGATVDSARGASAFIDACRSVRILETMTSEEAAKQKIDNAKPYFRAFSGKLNFAPASEKSTWYRIAGVPILNGSSAHISANGGNGGDDVGVVEAWELPSTVEIELTPEQITAIKAAVKQGEWREDVRAGMWVGKAIAPILGFDPEADKTKLRKAIRHLLTDGALKTIPGKVNRRPCLFVVTDDWTATVVELVRKKDDPK
ncbi:MAG: AAA family ATPase [Pseudolabrys sp.]